MTRTGEPGEGPEGSGPGDGLTAGLAEQAAGLEFSQLPESVVTVALQCVLDTLGVTLAARDDPVTTTLLAAWADEMADGESTLLDGSGRRVSAGSAALVNGTAAHAIDFDDMHPAMIGHPSAPLVPAVLALGEELGAGGTDVVAALVAGHEVQCRVGAAIAPSHYSRGFHPTGTVATFGVAAAAARLLHLDADGVRRALGIAGTQAAGLKSMFGTMSKPLHSGKAAANGIMAAKLAAAGFSSAPDVLESRQGFFAAEADEADITLVASEFGHPWYTLGIVFKLHAACGFTHAAIEAMLAARQACRPEEVQRVELVVHPELLAAANIEEPTTPLEAKFSVRFVAAMALLRGSVAAADFRADLTSDPNLQDFSRRVSVTADGTGRLGRLATSALVRTRSGAELRFDRDGSRPLWTDDPREQWERLRTKFGTLVHPVLGARAAKLAAHVGTLAAIPNVRSFVRALAA
jgi:2-methylcitrate dehydratase PrpD